MKRPGIAGMMILIAFGIVFVIEFNTILGMVGIDIASQVYFPVAVSALSLLIAAVYLLSERDGPDAKGAA